jgi:hypothetical protein
MRIVAARTCVHEQEERVPLRQYDVFFLPPRSADEREDKKHDE